jgi:hypothetical protein
MVSSSGRISGILELLLKQTAQVCLHFGEVEMAGLPGPIRGRQRSFIVFSTFPDAVRNDPPPGKKRA